MLIFTATDFKGASFVGEEEIFPPFFLKFQLIYLPTTRWRAPFRPFCRYSARERGPGTPDDVSHVPKIDVRFEARKPCIFARIKTFMSSESVQMVALMFLVWSVYHCSFNGEI